MSHPFLLFLTLIFSAVPVPEKMIVVDGNEFAAELSPDRTGALWVSKAHGNSDIYLSDADGKNSRRLTRDRAQDYSPCWTNDGKLIVFCSKRSGIHQIHSMDTNGENVKQLTREPKGARMPRVNAKGILAYLRMGERRGKVHAADLMIKRPDDEPTAIIKDFHCNDYAWSPDGGTLAVGADTGLIFFDVKNMKSEKMAFVEKDKRLYAHGASRLTWNPDGRQVACWITFLGGRAIGPGEGEFPAIFGDEEFFLISRDGKFEFLKKSEFDAEKLGWLKNDAVLK